MLAETECLYAYHRVSHFFKIVSVNSLHIVTVDLSFIILKITC